MNTTNIKAFFVAHKTAISICAVVLVIGSKSFSEGFKSAYNEQTNQEEMNGYPQNMQPQEGGYSRGSFGGNEKRTNENYNTNNAGNQAYYPTNNNMGYTGGNYATSGNYGADYTSGYEKQQAAYDRTSENFSDYMRDQGNYEDADGNTYKLNSNYSNNYVNTTTGEYVQSNDANYDPNQYSTSSYTAVTPSSYSSSSYSSSSESGE